MFKDELIIALYEAYLSARKNKRHTEDEQKFEKYADIFIAELADEILERRYQPSPGIAFINTKPVIREIFAAPFRDRVVHHFIFNQVADWWDKRFIYDNYSCRKGKGTLFGIKRLQHHMASVSQNWHKPAYVLKLDLSGYFMSLPRDYLFTTADWGISKQFGIGTDHYKLLRYLWKQIIFNDPTIDIKIRGGKILWAKLPASKSLFKAESGCGIVIGNLTSQLLSNMYLDQLDRYITFNLGFKHYGRYVDDFYLVATDKQQLIDATPLIEKFLDGIGLKLHPNKRHLVEVNKGVPFLGAVVYPYRIQPGRRVKNGYKQAVFRYQSAGGDKLSCDDPRVISLISYHGHIQHFRHKKLRFETEGK